VEAGEECDGANGCNDDCTWGILPQCQSYKVLNEADRNASYENHSVVKCDSNMNGEWYRFQAPAGTKMPTSPPGEWHCGTHAAGWMQGSYPNVGEGAVDRQVCFQWDNKTCWQTSAIKVLNCGDYYLFKLPKPLSCSYRYCGT